MPCYTLPCPAAGVYDYTQAEPQALVKKSFFRTTGEGARGQGEEAWVKGEGDGDGMG